jgi:hypothetical protein
LTKIFQLNSPARNLETREVTRPANPLPKQGADPAWDCPSRRNSSNLVQNPDAPTRVALGYGWASLLSSLRVIEKPQCSQPWRPILTQALAYGITWKGWLLPSVPLGVATVTNPVVASVGTVVSIAVSERTVKEDDVPLKLTAVVPVRLLPRSIT